MSDAVDDIEDALRAFAGGDLERWLDMCSDDVEFEFPFAPEGRTRTIHGRGDAATYLRSIAAAASDRSIRSLTMHRTETPGVIVIELTVRGTHGEPTGEHVDRDTSSIAVVTLRQGKVSKYRDYWNPQGGRLVSRGAAE
ncbi:nuclear transport factor 2 family protein [Curtobacterium sp. MCBD17_003]|uniref:nuclear transport factor 2 family protein n=1 Tax=Curtobacterium sp. MCBD17_003 TaxID=2175667 RepID=UPI0015E8936C|nr:nuclear transport factor 2 family protein [Curtobacterium sp. MCBD17_003]WIE54756.1 nuclear transport factor 2 family protein [Curtobacterium sp. MCBD17_003]